MSANTPHHLSPSHSPSPQSREGEDQTLSIGAFEPVTRAMGPGVRACLWVRGCPMRCRGCITPEFLEFPEGHPYGVRSLPLHLGGGDQEGVVRSRVHQESQLLGFPRDETGEAMSSPRDRRTLQQPSFVGGASTMPPPLTPPPSGRGRNGTLSLPYADTTSVSALCAQIDTAIAQHGITGVSFSGGEPFAQARALAAVAQHARARGLSTLSWSGFSRAFLESPRAPDGAKQFLASLDVLIDGPFVQRHANDDPLRGSSNQRIHLLTERHRGEEFDTSVVEVRMDADGATITFGVMQYAATDTILAILGVNTDDANPSRR